MLIRSTPTFRRRSVLTAKHVPTSFDRSMVLTKRAVLPRSETNEGHEWRMKLAGLKSDGSSGHARPAHTDSYIIRARDGACKAEGGGRVFFYVILATQIGDNFRF